ncbi:hypothetical protein B296_00026360 [Ensete ventricosum]|uniref:Leucine-rich repeat-containing N-terminal plant-type domain-containing protein n=1 Tax=Ensete ventricosum TaxID=4639 RepID=A0A426X483_ENSVE|nr:hypothetical protein B296_00026360 [Ensete ventricosum]
MSSLLEIPGILARRLGIMACRQSSPVLTMVPMKKGLLLLFIIIAGLHQGSSNTYPADEAPNWFSDLHNLTTLRLSNNAFGGTLNMSSNITQELKIVNFQNNLLTSITLSSYYNDTLK